MKYIRTILLGLLIMLLLKTGVVSSFHIPFSGMENSLYEGDRVLVNKWSYGLRTPFISWLGYHRITPKKVKKNDIVVYNNPSFKQSQKNFTAQGVFISRCVGTPGDTLFLQKEKAPYLTLDSFPAIKKPYLYTAIQEDDLTEAMQRAAIYRNQLMDFQGEQYIRYFNTEEINLLRKELGDSTFFRAFLTDSVTKENYCIIPGEGMDIQFTKANINFYAKLIRMHEGKFALVKKGKLYIGNTPHQHYRFTQDYYWMLSNNTFNTQDSRRYGPVPQSHLIGKAFLIWLSKTPHSSLIEGYRWDRILKSVQ